MPAAVLQPVYFPWLSMSFASIAASATLVVLGEAAYGNGYRPLRQWLKLERALVSYNVTTANANPWTLEVYDNGGLVIDEDFERATSSGWRTYERDLDIAVRANNVSSPGILTTKIQQPAGTGLTGVSIFVEGYFIDP